MHNTFPFKTIICRYKIIIVNIIKTSLGNCKVYTCKVRICSSYPSTCKAPAALSSSGIITQTDAARKLQCLMWIVHSIFYTKVDL